MLKPTGWMSNSREVLNKLSKRCTSRGSCSRRRGGRHATASGRTAREAAVYPFKLCRAILEGCRNQLLRDGKLTSGIHGYQALFEEDNVRSLQPSFVYCDAVTGEVLDEVESKVAENVFSVSDPGKTQYKDSATGQLLEPALVKAARQLELEYFEDKQVSGKMPYTEAMAKMGKKATIVKRIDMNNGDEDNPNYRSHIVAREIRKHGGNPIFAPTRPLECRRTVLSVAATDME